MKRLEIKVRKLVMNLRQSYEKINNYGTRQMTGFSIVEVLLEDFNVSRERDFNHLLCPAP